MISINISPSGELNLSVERVGERVAMHKAYEETNKGEPDVKPEVDSGEIDPHSYSAGWSASAGLAAVAFDKGEISEFFENNIVGWTRPSGEHPYEDAPKADDISDSEKPLLQELIETVGNVIEEDGQQRQITGYTRTSSGFERQTEALDGSKPENAEVIPPGATAASVFRPEFAPTADEQVEMHHADIRPAVDSGEPDKELLDTPVREEGVWTMTPDELDSRLAAEYERGKADGSTAHRPTTKATLHKMAEEWLRMDDDDLSDPDEYMITVGKDSIDTRFVEYLARRLGYSFS